jgi:uncharacterized protein
MATRRLDHNPRMNWLVRRSNPAELQAFDLVCERLGGFVDDLDPEWVDGFLTALAAGPRVPDEAEWLGALAGDAFDRVFADPPDQQQALRALRTRLAVLRDQLDPEALDAQPDVLRLDPLLLEWTDDARAEALAAQPLPEPARARLHTGVAWAEGFGQAVARLAAVWAQPTTGVEPESREFHADCLSRIRLLSLPPESEAFAQERARLRTEDPRAARAAGSAGEGTPTRQPDLDRNDLIDDACFAAQDLRLWWVDHQPRPETRVVGPQPGRNDPCPCGSGRKFKKCHGA